MSATSERIRVGSRSAGVRGGALLRWLLLGAAAAILAVGALTARRTPADYGAWVALLIAVQVVGGILTPLAAWAWRGVRVGPVWVAAVLVFGFVVRLVTLSATEFLSDDAARYHWDGKCLAHGVNPYAYAPADTTDTAVAELRGDPLDARINHPRYRTCYPPVAQAIFAVGYRLTPGSLRGFQSLCLVAELLAWWLLLRALPRHGRPRSAVLVLAWAPLVVFQGYLPGHLDTLTLPFVVLLVLLAETGRGAATGLVLGLACLIKPLPLWHAPALARSLGPARARRSALVFAAVFVAAYLPFASAGWRLFESTWAMATRWSYNGSGAALLAAVLPGAAARVAAGGLLAVLLWLGVSRGRDLLARMLLAQTAFIVCTPALFPWYLIGLLPLLALRTVVSLSLLIALVPLADVVLVGYRHAGVWNPPAWPQLVIYLPFAVALLAELIRDRRD